VTCGDTWEERYLALIPEKLSWQDAQVLFDLIAEAPERFIGAIQDFIENSKDEPGGET
jgi:hypothetical protein